jgi:hypothetical protein
MTPIKTIQIGDTIHSNWFGDGAIIDLDASGFGKIKFGSILVTFTQFEIFYDHGWRLSI